MNLKPFALIIENLKEKGFIDVAMIRDRCELGFMISRAHHISNQCFVDCCASRHTTYDPGCMLKYQALDHDQHTNTVYKGGYIRIDGTADVRVKQVIEG